MIVDVKRCSRCVLSETFPKITFSPEGLCSYCQEAPGVEEIKQERNQLKNKLEMEIKKNIGIGEYDCIVAFSGGKDSSYTLMHLVQNYKLNCLAVTIDNGFVSEQARENCYVVTDKLGVDFVMMKPSSKFMMNMYKTSAINNEMQTQASIKRASAMCNSCINLINNYMLKIAILHNSPLVAGGYIGGQVPNNAALLNIDLIQRENIKSGMKEKYIKLFGEESNKFFFIHDTLIKQLKSKITVINPMLTLSVSEEEIIAEVQKLGWSKTSDTGRNSSNCQLNDLGIAIHFKQHKFHPYELEVAEQVRYGLMSREVALKKIGEIPDISKLSSQMNKVGLTVNEI